MPADFSLHKKSVHYMQMKKNKEKGDISIRKNCKEMGLE